MKRKLVPLALLMALMSILAPSSPCAAVAQSTCQGGCSEAEIRAYLQCNESPLADYTSTLIEAGRRHNIDPRFLIAIAGAESTFGRHPSGNYNAWNWHVGRDYKSWEAAIETVAEGIRRLHIDQHGHDTIPEFVYRGDEGSGGTCEGTCYCVTGCPDWIPNVSTVYRELGGDPNNIGFSFPACLGEAPSEAGSISGIVTAADGGKAISGATVTFEGEGNIPPATTGSEGQYTFKEVPAGKATITASASGFESKSVEVTVETDKPNKADIALVAASPPWWETWWQNVQTWWDERKKELDDLRKRWDEFWKTVREVEEFVRQLRQCFGGEAALLIPALAFALWRRRNK